MGLNTIRLEGKLETRRVLRPGRPVRASWSCRAGAAATSGRCGTSGTRRTTGWAPPRCATRSCACATTRACFVVAQRQRLPAAGRRGEGLPRRARRSCEWSKPILSNATDTPGPVSGPTGVKMRGPYDYVPPSYWLTDTQEGRRLRLRHRDRARRGGAADREPAEDAAARAASGRSTSSGSSTPAATSSRTSSCSPTRSRAATARRRASRTTPASRRPSTYEGQRAMFEAYGRNKYTSTGVIQWMLNNAWPSMIWHLYDYYLRPGGGYFGTKKALRAAARAVLLRRPLGGGGERPAAAVHGPQGEGAGLRPGPGPEVLAARPRWTWRADGVGARARAAQGRRT